MYLTFNNRGGWHERALYLLRSSLTCFVLLSMASCIAVNRRPDVFFADVKLDSNGQVVFSNLLEISRNKYYLGKNLYLSRLKVHEVEFRKKDRYKGEIVWQIDRKGINSGILPPHTNLPKQVIYGKLPVGMIEVTRSKPLKKGTLYRISIRTTQAPIIAHFMVDSNLNGRLTGVRTLNDSRSLTNWEEEQRVR